MSLKSVLFIAYDIYTEGMTDYIEDASIPSIYLYPAKSKAENYVKYETKRKGKSDNLDQNDLIRFIEKNVKIKINLPKSLGIKDPKQGPSGKTRSA